MAVVGRAAWERQQQRARAAEAVRRLPPLATCLPLALAAQMPAILEQLRLSDGEEHDARFLKRAVRTGGGSIDGAAAPLLVAMLLRSWASRVAQGQEKYGQIPKGGLGAWFQWQCDPERGIKAVEAAGWGDWVTLLLPLLPGWPDVATALLLAAQTPSLVACLLEAVALHAETCLLSDAHIAADVLRCLDTRLLQGPPPPPAAVPALARLQRTLDAWVDAKINKINRSNKNDTDTHSEVFSAACQLRARLAITLALAGGGQPSDEGSSGDDDSSLDMGRQECAAVWASMLLLGPLTDQKPGALPPLALALAAHVTVAALFDDGLSDPLSPEFKAISDDANPVSPARVAWAALSLLHHSAAAGTGNVASYLSTLNLRVLQLIPRLIWALCELVKDDSQRQALLQWFVQRRAMGGARRALARCEGFQDWARRETVVISNKLRSDEAQKVEVLGVDESGIAAAVAAVFPAALLCPAALLEVLVGGAVGDAGRVSLLAALLREIPVLRELQAQPAGVESAVPEQSALILDLLCAQLALESVCQLTEGGKQGLERCVTTLCCGDAAPLPPLPTLRTAVLPALQEASEDPVGYAGELPLLLRLARRLVAAAQGTAVRVSLFPEGTAASGLGMQLIQPCLELLAPSSRRIDLTSRGLELPLAVAEEAHALASLCCDTARSGGPELIDALLRAMGTGTELRSTGAAYLRAAAAAPLPPPPLLPTAPPAASTVWDSLEALIPSLWRFTAGAGAVEGPALARVCAALGPTRLREALLVAVGVTLPCCSVSEAQGVVEALKEATQWCLERSAQPRPTAVAAATIEVLCRALHALALVPALVPVAGEDVAGKDAVSPSPLRRRAVARLAQHLSAACQAAVDQISSENAAQRAVLAARAFAEVARCAAALASGPLAADVGVLTRVCLPHLARTVKDSAAGGEPSREVRRALEDAAGGLGDPMVSAAVAAALPLE